MSKKIIFSIIYTFFGFLIFIVLFPTLFAILNALLNLPTISFPFQKILGILLFLIGAFNYLYCHKYFFFQGNRTPLITEKSTQLLNTGLYQYSRNPIYIGHVILLLGIFFFLGDLLLLFYTLLIFFLLNLLIICYEEPHLKKSLGKEYENYLHQVPRWL